jgi:hypothetical protein
MNTSGAKITYEWLSILNDLQIKIKTYFITFYYTIGFLKYKNFYKKFVNLFFKNFIETQVSGILTRIQLNLK